MSLLNKIFKFNCASVFIALFMSLATNVSYAVNGSADVKLKIEDETKSKNSEELQNDEEKVVKKPIHIKEKPGVGDLIDKRGEKLGANCEKEFLLKDKEGTNHIDWLNYCYVPIEEDVKANGDRADDYGSLSCTVFSYKFAEVNGGEEGKQKRETQNWEGKVEDSIFKNVGDVKVDFVDAAGEVKFTTIGRVVTNNQITGEPLPADDPFCAHVFKVTKNDLPFGTTYTLKFYEANAESKDENLLATYDLTIEKEETPEVGDLIDKRGKKLGTNDEKEFLLKDREGKNHIDGLIYSYMPTEEDVKANGYDADYKGSISFDVKVDCVDAAGEVKFTTIGRVVTHSEAGKALPAEDPFCVHVFKVTKNDLPFGTTYTLKFYEANAESNDGNLLATYDLTIDSSKKPA